MQVINLSNSNAPDHAFLKNVYINAIQQQFLQSFFCNDCSKSFSSVCSVLSDMLQPLQTTELFNKELLRATSGYSCWSQGENNANGR